MSSRKRALKAGVVAVLGVMCAFVFAACTPSENIFVELSSPSGLAISNNSLTWNAVTHATEYRVDIDGIGYDAASNSFSLMDLTEAKTYQIKVRAVGDGTAYTDSDWSAAIPYTVTAESGEPPASQKLATPSGLQIGGTALTWTAVADAESYKVDIDGIGYDAALNSFSLMDLTEAKTYQIKVRAVGDGTAYTDSDWSAVISYTVAMQGVSGSGTYADPFTLSTAAHLVSLAEEVNAGEKYADKYFILTKNIDLNGVEWTPVGNHYDRYFEGYFNGNGFVVSNFTVTVAQENVGLFGVNNGTIRDLGVENFVIDIDNPQSGSSNCGGLVGQNRAFGSIFGSYAAGSISVNRLTNSYAGGLAGRNEGMISNSYASVTVNAQSSNTAVGGGLVGATMIYAMIIDCYAIGDVTVQAANRAYAGGLVGNNDAMIRHSFATGAAHATATGATGTAYAGGVAGATYTGGMAGQGVVTNCYRPSGQAVSASGATFTKNTIGLTVTNTDFSGATFFTAILGWHNVIWDYAGVSLLPENYPKLRGAGTGVAASQSPIKAIELSDTTKSGRKDEIFVLLAILTREDNTKTYATDAEVAWISTNTAVAISGDSGIFMFNGAGNGSGKATVRSDTRIFASCALTGLS